MCKHHSVVFDSSGQTEPDLGRHEYSSRRSQFVLHILLQSFLQCPAGMPPPDQRWSNRTRVIVLVFEYEYFLSTRTRVRSKVIVLVLEYITKVIVLTITSHDYIFFI